MIVEEMRSALEKYCITKDECDECSLYLSGRSENGCYSECASDCQVTENYMFLFGSPNDAVDHPSHYQGKHECIDEMIALFGVEAVKAFCKCNVYKYRYRAAAKNGQEDLDKADWYMDKLMELEGEKHD